MKLLSSAINHILVHSRIAAENTLKPRLYSTKCIESGLSDDNFCETFGLHMTQMSSFKDSEFKDFCVNFCLCSVFNVFIEKKYASLKGEVRGNPDPPSYAPVLVACVASVSVRFRSKERGTRVKMALVSFLVRPKPRIPFLGLSLLRNQTKTLSTQATVLDDHLHLADSSLSSHAH